MSRLEVVYISDKVAIASRTLMQSGWYLRIDHWYDGPYATEEEATDELARSAAEAA